MVEKKIEAAAAAAGVEWLRPFPGVPTALYANLYRGAFGTLVRALQAQADFARKLSECEGPAEALACQVDFLRSASTTCVDEARRGFQSLQSAFTSTSGA